MVHVAVQLVHESIEEALLLGQLLCLQSSFLVSRNLTRHHEVDSGFLRSAWYVRLFLFNIAASINASVPVEALAELREQVDCLAVRGEHDDFFVLVSV